MPFSKNNRIDGGYGWAVVAASFVCHAIADGCVYSVGVLYVELLEAFQESKSKTSLVGSLLLGMSLFFGTASSFLVERFGCRKVTIAGGIIATFGHVSSAFAPSINVLCVTYGVIAALGISMIYVPALVIVSMYFEKKRALATGIAVCGSGIGTLVFPPLCEVLIQEFQWQGMLLIMGGIVANFCVCGALFRPIELWPPHSIDNQEDKSVLNGNGDLTISVEPKSVKTKDWKDTGEYFKMPERRHRGNPLYVYRNCRTGILFNSTPSISCTNDSTACSPDCSFSQNNSNKMKEYTANGDYVHQIICREKTELTQSCPELRKINVNRSIAPRDSKPCDNIRQKSIFSRTIQTPVKIFYQAVVSSKSRVWIVLFILHNFVLYFWIDIPYMFLVDRAILLEIDSTAASLLLSISGITNTVGQLVFGVLGDRNAINTCVTYSLAIMATGIGVAAIPFCKTYSSMAITAAVFGFFISANYTLCTVLLIEQLGLRALTVAYGVIMLFQGIGNMGGPPTAGWMYDMQRTYDAAFYVAGAFIFLSGVLTIVLPTMQYLKAYSLNNGCHYIKESSS